MDGFIGKKFLIQSVVEPEPWVGADVPSMEPGATAPVITMGDMKEWTYVDGYLILNGDWYSTREGDGVVVRSGVSEGMKWVIMRVDEGYRIEVPGTDMCWTASGVDPKEPVIVRPSGSVNPKYQLWNFVPAN